MSKGKTHQAKKSKKHNADDLERFGTDPEDIVYGEDGMLEL